MNKQEYYSDYKWIKVKRYVDDPELPLETRLERLEDHHMKETTFLLDEIRKLAKEIDELRDAADEKHWN